MSVNMMPYVPHKYLSKMGSYSVELHGSKVEVKVVDDESFIETNIKRLLSSLTIPRVISIDAKHAIYDDDDSTGHVVLVLCANSFCLILQLHDKIGDTDNLIQRFFNDPELCLVSSLWPGELPDMNVQQLAARVLKKPSLCRASLAEICSVVGVKYHGSATGEVASISVESLCPTILSEEQVEVVIADAYACQHVARKLLASL